MHTPLRLLTVPRLRFWTFIGAFAILCASLAFGPAQPSRAACLDDQAPASREGQQAAPASAVPHVGTPEEINRDRDWPVVAVTRAQVLDADGRPVIATITERRNPSPRPQAPAPHAAFGIGPNIAAATPCAFDTNPSFTMDTPTANGQFAMHSKFFFDRWIAGTYPGSDWVYAYVSTQTNVWWTRSDSNYDVFAGEQTNTWFFNAISCSTSAPDPHSASGGNWVPSWLSSTESVTYVYTSPMNGWPVLFKPLVAGYDIHLSQTTNVAYLGERYASLSNTFIPAQR